MLLRKKFLILLTQLIFISNFAYAEGSSKINIEDSIDTGEEESIEAEGSKNKDISLPLDKVDSNSRLYIQGQGESELIPYNTSKIIALNKITAQSKELILKIGESKYFGNIEIKVHKCLKDTNLYSPNNRILITITEDKIDEESNLLFQGWMMSSNISISTFEHPVYEVFARDCF